MPIPAVLTSPAYALVWTGNLNVEGKRILTPGQPPIGGPIKTKTFHSYVEVREQGAHDAAIRGAVVQRGMTNRPFHVGRVRPNNTHPTPLNYYSDNVANTAGHGLNPGHGQVAAQLAGIEMTRRWTNNVTNNTVFVRGQSHVLVGQGVVQANGHCYETTMWYDVNDVYVAFHCYDPVFRG
jgi:hypothetical protein